MEPAISSALPSSSPSLPEVHSSVDTSHLSLWKRLFAFAGPAYLVSVGYMDPGNWATDLEGGAIFGYQLLWVLVMSNAMAVLLQTLSARLGIVTRRDLAQACREAYPPAVSRVLWVLCEIAIAACDLAELLGAAIALNLLLHIPLIVGVLITSLDTLFILWLSSFGIRKLEAVVLSLVVIIGGCFLVEILLAKPDWSQMAAGLVPTITSKNLYVAIGILGATVMPHNLYLHSSLVQTRQIGVTDQDKRQACHFNLIDSVVALNGALLVNAAILVLSAAVFFTKGIAVTEIQQAHLLLAPLLGTTLASGLFAVALLASGQSSTLTGTLAGQIVMEGFLNFRMRPWLRRLITRLLAVFPAVLTLFFAGEKASYQLLILSQVVLSLQLPFAIIPLIQFTSDRKRMGSFVNKAWVKVLAWGAAAVIIALNVWLIASKVMEWLAIGGWVGWVTMFVVVPVCTGLAVLLVWVTFRSGKQQAARPVMPEAAVAVPAAPLYQTILVPLDHTDRDRTALAHASSIAKQHGATLLLLHVEEGATIRVYGAQTATGEVEEGRRYLDGIAETLRKQGIAVETLVCFSAHPREEIVRVAKERRPDLLVMGAHGHKGLQDLLFGETINAVRHDLSLPLLIVRDPEEGK